MIKLIRDIVGGLAFAAVIGAIGIVAIVAGCSATQRNDPTTVFSTVETAYAGALAGEMLYLNSGKADPATVRQIEVYRVGVHNTLAPIEAEIAAGHVPASTDVLAAQTAMSALTAYLNSKNISTTGN